MSDRHEKWTPVTPGTVIPAGQPYRVERNDSPPDRATEYVRDEPWNIPLTTIHEWFVDSSWKPPLVLPTEPTWGMAVTRDVADGTLRAYGDRWVLVDNGKGIKGTLFHWHTDSVLDFIPLTDEQVARIEAAR